MDNNDWKFSLDVLFENAKSIKTKIKKVFIVDDSMFALDHFCHIILLLDPTIEIIGARSTDQAKKIFLACKDDIDLVLMDYRLEDAASGATLTKSFIMTRPDVLILANSALKEYNKKLLEAGAKANIHKNIPAFLNWWINYNR